jgi:hypothetical protein
MSTHRHHQSGAWQPGASAPVTPHSDTVLGLLHERAEALIGCEASAEEAERKAIGAAIDAYEQERWRDGTVLCGKGWPRTRCAGEDQTGSRAGWPDGALASAGASISRKRSMLEGSGRNREPRKYISNITEPTAGTLYRRGWLMISTRNKQSSSNPCVLPSTISRTVYIIPSSGSVSPAGT